MSGFSWGFSNKRVLVPKGLWELGKYYLGIRDVLGCKNFGMCDPDPPGEPREFRELSASFSAKISATSPQLLRELYVN